MGRDRQIWVDCVKGFTIIVVVLLHINYQFPSFAIKNLIGDAWDMPVFYLVAGFFLKEDQLLDLKGFLRRKFSSVYAKLLWFYVIILLLHNVFIYTGFYNPAIEYGGKYMAILTLPEFLLKLIGVLFFAGREPYASPLWFVYVLFEAFIALTILANLLYFLSHSKTKMRLELLAVTFLIATEALVLTNNAGITIQRCSNVFPAMWLICVGYAIKNLLKEEFTSTRLFVLSLAVVVPLCLFCDHMAMMTNTYNNILQLTLVGVAALYVVCFVSRKIEGNAFGRLIAYFGRNSFAIMALHLLAINIFAYALNLICKSNLPIDILGCQADNVWMLLLLTVAGTVLSAGFYSLVMYCKSNIVKLWRKH